MQNFKGAIFISYIEIHASTKYFLPLFMLYLPLNDFVTCILIRLWCLIRIVYESLMSTWRTLFWWNVCNKIQCYSTFQNYSVCTSIIYMYVRFRSLKKNRILYCVLLLQGPLIYTTVQLTKVVATSKLIYNVYQSSVISSTTSNHF